MKKATLLFCALWFALSSPAQQKAVSINETGAAPDASSILDVQSTTKGILFPRMTSQQRDAIISPAEGLEIYNSSRKCKEIFNGLQWVSIVPAGTIQPYAGDTTKIPLGWLLCDGRQVSRTTFSDLYYVISINWGAGDLMTTFHLPDLRGMFIRGVDYTAGNDPNKITRNFQHTGGNSGNNIGSLQEDAFQGHKHQLFDGESSNTYAKETVDFVQGSGIGAIRWCSAQDHNCITAPTTDSANGTPRTTSETRPKNVYVNYIIKY